MLENNVAILQVNKNTNALEGIWLDEFGINTLNRCLKHEITSDEALCMIYDKLVDDGVLTRSRANRALRNSRKDTVKKSKRKSA